MHLINAKKWDILDQNVFMGAARGSLQKMPMWKKLAPKKCKSCDFQFLWKISKTICTKYCFYCNFDIFRTFVTHNEQKIWSPCQKFMWGQTESSAPHRFWLPAGLKTGVQPYSTLKYLRFWSVFIPQTSHTIKFWPKIKFPPSS